MISIICPTYNEENFIAKCIESMLTQDYTGETELLIIDGRSIDKTREIVEEIIAKTPQSASLQIRLLDNPNRTAPYALNIGIREAKGEVIMRIDAHSDYPNNYVSVLVEKLYELCADNVGGVWNILPANNTAEAISIAMGSSHPFGVGNSIYRIGAKNIMEVDTVPFGCYRRNVFERIGYFDEELTRNQDNEFNARLKNAGGKIYLIPEIIINYTARDTWSKMYRMYYQYALFSPLVNKKLGKPDSIKRFLPALALIFAVTGFFAGFAWNVVWRLMLICAALYFITGMAIGIQAALRLKRFALVVCMPVTFFLMHLAYATGYVVGKYKVILGKSFNAKANR
jgi:glycosyltransferase involved in cell wall biosynthesis